MAGKPWLALVELFLVKKLLESAAFHRAVGKAHKSVHRLRHGIPPEELGGTNIDNPAGRGFLGHFVDELKGQAGAAPGKAEITAKRTPGSNVNGTARQQQQQQSQQARPHAQDRKTVDADDSSQNPGFINNFLDEIKDQFRSGNKNR